MPERDAVVQAVVDHRRDQRPLLRDHRLALDQRGDDQHVVGRQVLAAWRSSCPPWRSCCLKAVRAARSTSCLHRPALASARRWPGRGSPRGSRRAAPCSRAGSSLRRAAAGAHVVAAQPLRERPDLRAREALGDGDLDHVRRHALLERVERGREAHVLAQLVRARPEVAAVAGEPGAELEEAGVVTTPACSSRSAIWERLEPCGIVTRTVLAAVALERLEERVGEPGDAEDDRDQDAEAR